MAARIPSPLRSRWLGAAFLLALTPAAYGQAKYIGPAKCVGCHDHEKQALQWQKTEPATLGGKAHFITRKQLDAPKAAGFAKAIGLSDPYAVTGSCVKCHATVFGGDANAGVSCESCHGAASVWNDIHQQKGAYPKALAAGMKDLKGKIPEIVKVCVECHVTNDKRLVAAGHPVGDKFDVGASMKKLTHWTTAYDFAAVSAAGRPAIASRAGGAGGGGGAAAGGAAKPPAAGGGAAAGGAKPPAAGGGEPAGKPAAGGGGGSAAPSAPEAAPAPWDWDAPVRELPKDYQPGAETPAPKKSGGARRPKPTPELSMAEDPALPAAIPGGEGGALAPAVESAAEAKKATASPTPGKPGPEDLRARTVSLMDKLVRSGARKADLPPAAKPKEFHGPDSELRRIEDEALALAIEALRQEKKP